MGLTTYVSNSASPTMRRIKPSTRSVPPSWLIPPMATCPSAAKSKWTNEVSPQRFPYYLKELEFRYNHRKTDLFPLITKSLCNLVPKRD